MNKQKKAFYISSKITNTIIQSQVINWVKLLNESGNINFTLIFQVPVIDFFRSNEKKKYKAAKESIDSRVVKMPIIRSKWNLLAEKIILFTYLMWSTRKVKNEVVIIQTRENKHAKLISWLKKYRKIFFIYEHRGVGAEEYINNLGFNSIEDVKENEIRERYFAILKVYESIFKIADVIVNVSEQMKIYVHERFNKKYDEKLHVIPGGADQEIFFYSLADRQKLRDSLKIKNDQTVLLYSGSLKQRWHMRDFIFETVSYIQKKEPDIFFICVTPDTEIAVSLAKEYNLNHNKNLIGFVKNSDINSYLNAADIGLIFREDMATNKFSSPTKVAEYLTAGLPVIISEGIGDYSEFVKKEGLGAVVKNDTNSIVSNIAAVKALNRSMIAKRGSASFSKQNLMLRYFEIYNTINA